MILRILRILRNLRVLRILRILRNLTILRILGILRILRNLWILRILRNLRILKKCCGQNTLISRVFSPVGAVFAFLRSIGGKKRRGAKTAKYARPCAGESELIQLIQLL